MSDPGPVLPETGGIRRARTALVALALFAVTAGVLLRLVTSGSPGSSARPMPGPSPSGQVDPFFPTFAEEANASPDTGIGGMLVEDHGCVFVREGDGVEVLIIWPHAWSVERAASGDLRVLDETGASVIEVGHRVALHGGGFHYEPEFLEELIGQPVPLGCRTFETFLTSGLWL